MSVRKLLATASLGAATLVALATPAFAHVTVDPAKVDKGADVELTFHVPNESPKANTTKVQMQLPTDSPFSSVLVAPEPGWTATTTTTKLTNPITNDDGATVTDVVSTITWTGGTIKPGAYQDFAILVGPIPTTGTSLNFPTVQTYDDGTTVQWIQVSSAAGAAADHPAPSVAIVAGPGGGGGSNNTKTLAEIDAIVAVIALGVGGYALVQLRHRHR